MNSNLIKVFFVGLALLILLIAVSTVSAGKNQEKVCFCHNVNRNPHTICTSNKGKIKGHTKHVKNGTDYVGRCKTDSTPSPSPTVSPSPSETPEPTENPTERPTEHPSPTITPTPEPTSTPFVHQACNHSCLTDQECRDKDGSYICHLGQCRLEEAPERQECDPRPMTYEEFRELEGNPETFGPQK